MRAYEFITESKDLLDYERGLKLAAAPLPHTYVLPELTNQNFYEIYRFGLAVADVRGENGKGDGVQNKFRQSFEAESDWGEHLIISSFDPDIGSVLDKALNKVHKGKKKLVSTARSEELSDTMNVSPMKPFKGYSK